jgi:hypothetical protein
MGSAPHTPGDQPQRRQRRISIKARAARIKARKARADARATEVAPVIAGLWAAGVTSMGDIAKALKERGIRTPTGKLDWLSSCSRDSSKALSAHCGCPRSGRRCLPGMPWLDVFCPGCGTANAIDLRTVDRHPLAWVGTLVLGLRCSWCPGSAPMPKTAPAVRPTASQAGGIGVTIRAVAVRRGKGGTVPSM